MNTIGKVSKHNYYTKFIISSIVVSTVIIYVKHVATSKVRVTNGLEIYLSIVCSMAISFLNCFWLIFLKSMLA